MPTLLALTVGGSCAPIVTALRDYRPEQVYFFVTVGSRGSRVTVEGAGNPCGDAPNIVTQANLGGSYTLVDLVEPDSLPDCYATIRRTLSQAIAEHGGWRFIADYTGGTKTMGVALALAALETGWELSLVRGTRTDLVKVLDGTEMASLVNAKEVRARQQLDEAGRLFDGYAFGSASALLESLTRTSPLSNEMQQVIGQRVAICRAFDAWDRFDHQRAKQLLQPYQGRVVAQWRFLKALTGERATGYEAVLDLVRNAERRAARGRYDDAVARLYRALEMFAQVRLSQLNPPLSASNLEVSTLPEGLQHKYESLRDPVDHRIKLGLRQDYELLMELADAVGETYRQYSSRLLDALSRRNNSILAHGTTSLSESGYQSMANQVAEFIAASLQALQIKLDAPQFPNWNELTR